MRPGASYFPPAWFLGITAIVVAVSGYHPGSSFDWWLENILVAAMLLFLIATVRVIPLSNFAYGAILLFLVVHEWGAHHKYSDVPLGEWMKVWLNTKRNHFDRVAHFAFGLFLSVPLREAFIVTSGHRGFWGFFIPVEFSLAAGAIYECIEAVVAEIVTPEQGEAFVGMQGDMWDAQKDIALGGLGAAITMSVLAVFARRSRQSPSVTVR